MSGGEPCEVQFKLREEPAGIVTVDIDKVSIFGEAVYRDERCLSDGMYK